MDSKLSRNAASPSKTRRSSSSSRRKSNSDDRDVPIKFISIQVEEDDHRDDEVTNVLVTLIQKRDWNGILHHMQGQEGINDAGHVLPSKDYPLHMLCKCGRDYKFSKYSVSGSSRTTESGSSTDVSSRANSSISGSGTLTSTEPSIHTKDVSSESQNDSLPSKTILEIVVNAFPDALQKPGEDNATPLHW